MEWRLSGGVGNEDETIQVRVKLWEILIHTRFRLNSAKSFLKAFSFFQLKIIVKNNFLRNRRPIVVGFKLTLC